MNDNPAPDDDCPRIDSDSIVDDDPIAEVRRARAEIAAELANDFGGDWKRQRASWDLETWAGGLKIKIEGQDEPREPEIPADLSWLIPNRNRFLQDVMVGRCVAGSSAPDLDAFNEEGRRRARLLGFPEESFVVSPKDFPPDVDYSSPDWQKQLWPDEEPESASESTSAPRVGAATGSKSNSPNLAVESTPEAQHAPDTLTRS